MQRLVTGAWSRAPVGRARRARFAALALVAIQVGIGIVMKASQTGESYSFSPSGSIAISEFCKLVLSTIFFYRECRQRLRDGESLYVAVPSAEDGAGKSRLGLVNGRKTWGRFELDARTFWRYIRGEVPLHVRWGFCNLALFYVLINNSIFVSYKLADPGTIQLLKSGVTFITALVMIVALNTTISKTQWVAIAVQICGLVVTQYVPGSGSAYPLGTYLILLFQVFLSALSGVYNQALLKSGGSSLHADNMILYAAGASFNMLIHLVLRVLKADEPGFFTGYDTFSARMVVVSNIFIGLAITAVYKYADAIIKCFATAIATGILLYLSPILFGTKLSFLTIPGTLLVFLASWLYLDHPPPKPTVADMEKDAAKQPTVFEKLSASTKRSPAVVLGVSTLATVVIVAFLTLFAGELPGSRQATKSKPESGLQYSPFNRTMAMIRWNSALPERIPWLRKYEPFFHTVHISIPNNSEIKDEFAHTLSNDKAEFDAHIYVQLAMTMQKILDENPVIDGLFYFHFDAWVDPLQFGNMNFENIWLATSPDPEYGCTTKPEDIKWFWITEQGQHKNALAALEFLQGLNLGYKINDGEICRGWTDIYFIPRRFFKDYIFLSEVFRQFGTFHEMAIPTMLTIIDRTRKANDGKPVMDLFSDCWGSCCQSNPTAQELTTARCGHRLDYRKEEERKPFYDKLDQQALSLAHTSKSPPLTDLAPGYPRPLGNHKLKDEARISRGKHANLSSSFDHVSPKLDEFFDKTSKAKEKEGKPEPKKD